MKRLVVIALLSVFLTGCVNQSDYDDLVKKNEKLEKKVDSLEEENDDLRAEIKELTEKPVESTVETTSDTIPKPYVDDKGNVMMEVYDKTFTNPESGSEITISVNYLNGVIFVSNYKMPPHSYFDNDYQAEGAAGAYCGYILAILDADNSYTSGVCQSDEYYNSAIATADNDEGYIFVTSSRNGSVAIYENERDWYLEFAADMDNERYASSELTWIMDTFKTYTEDMQDITAKIKELK